MNKKNNFRFRKARGFTKNRTMVFYVASKTRHAHMWRALRATGVRINSTWIDEAEGGQTSNYSSLADRCIKEAASSDGVILYVESGDTLKGALLECGAALALGRPVVMVGKESQISRVFERHPLWHSARSVQEAICFLERAPTPQDTSEYLLTETVPT